MITGSLSDLKNSHATYPPIILKALKFLQSHDFTQMKDGRYYIEGEGCYANLDRYTTKQESRLESHRKFVDIQYLAEGEEFIGWRPLGSGEKVLVPYDEARDVGFFEAEGEETRVLLGGGVFAIFYPEDAHRPQMAAGAPAPVSKVVVKIAVDLL